MKGKIAYFFIILLTFFLFIFVPRGSTVVNNNVSLAPNGNPSIDTVSDLQSSFSLSDTGLEKKIKQQNVYGQSLEKRDFGFVVYYKILYRFDLSSINQPVPNKLILSASLPGTIETVIGGNLEANKAYWEVVVGKKGDYVAESKHVRWWLIFLTAILILFFSYILYSKHQLKND